MFPAGRQTGTSFFRTDFAPAEPAVQTAVDLAPAVAVAVCAVALVLINVIVKRADGQEG